MKKYSFFFIIVTVFQLLPVFTLAAVQGNVTDTNGDPVSVAKVTFTDESNPDTHFSGLTNAEGHYEIDISGMFVTLKSEPEAFSLGQNYPNPFNPTTTIPFVLTKAGIVRIDIFNITGQRVRMLINEFHPAGSYKVSWNARDEDGNPVSAGVYIYRLLSAGEKKAHKMLLLDGGYTAMDEAESSVSHGNAISSSKAATATWRIDIAGNDIETYTESNLVLTDGERYDFVITRLSGIKVYKGISFVSVPGGTFQMGNIENSSFGNSEEKPVHTVTLSPFEMSIYEITQGQYQSLMGMNPSYFKSGDEYPAERVSWYDAVVFCNRLSEKMGYEKCYTESGEWNCDYSKNGFRLPTEAEWEYACRAGTETIFYTGNAISGDGKTSADLGKAGWYESNNGSKTHPVGEKEPNTFGLFDMHGNICEWCNDWYGLYKYNNQINPKGPTSGLYRVERGGSWCLDAINCRSANRGTSNPLYPSLVVGFRVVRPHEKARLSLQGTITDSTGEPVSGATVTFINEQIPDIHNCFSGLTDEQGHYEITLIEPYFEQKLTSASFFLSQKTPNLSNKLFRNNEYLSMGEFEVSNAETEQTSKTLTITWSLKIMGNDIRTYTDSNLVLTDGERYDFVVTRLYGIKVYNGISFVSVPGGSFRMGDVQGKGYQNERPVHNVTLSAFEMSIYEITNAQYAQYLNEALAGEEVTAVNYFVTGKTGEYNGQPYLCYNRDRSQILLTNNKFSVIFGKEFYPVFNVTWYGAKAFALHYGFDLPTEAEWEYACRAGTETLFYMGNIMDSDGHHSSDLDLAGWYLYNSDTGGEIPRTHPVGRKEPNAWTLFDMHANVFEWCNDWYGDYQAESELDPRGAQTGSLRVMRGGCWGDYALICRSAFRYGYVPDYWNINTGFRVVRR